VDKGRLKERCRLESQTNFFPFKKSPKTECGLDSRIYSNFCIYDLLRTRATFSWPILYNSTPEGNICLSDVTGLSSIPLETTRNFRLLQDSHHPMQETEGIRKDTFINRYYSVHIYRQTTTGWNIRFPCVTKSLKFEDEVRIAVYDYLCYKSHRFWRHDTVSTFKHTLTFTGDHRTFQSKVFVTRVRAVCLVPPQRQWAIKHTALQWSTWEGFTCVTDVNYILKPQHKQLIPRVV